MRALALHYVAKYATTQAKLAFYLRRKIKERGWANETDPPVDLIVTYCVEAGYVDDRVFAQGRAAALGRRGFGPARVSQALQIAGVHRDIRAAVVPSDSDAVAAADRFARRRRIGGYGDGTADPAQRRRQFAAMLRAGHSAAVARRFVEGSGAEPDDFGLQNDT